MNQPTLALDNVALDYQGVDAQTIVKRATGHFHSGRLYAITYSSESNMLALLALIAGFARPSSGTIRIGNQPLEGMEPDDYRRRHIGLVLRKFPLVPQLSALDNVCLPIELIGNGRHEARTRAKLLLARVGLVGKSIYHHAARLDKNEQWRAAVARSMGVNPCLVLVDEAPSQITGEMTLENVHLFRDISHQEGTCIIMATRESRLARHADEVWAINEGILFPITLEVSKLKCR